MEATIDATSQGLIFFGYSAAPVSDHRHSRSNSRWSIATARAWDLRTREQLITEEVESVDAATMPGEAVTYDALVQSKTRRSLIQLIENFSTDGVAWGHDEFQKISSDTACAAILFLKLVGGKTPKVAPNGDGGLTLLWERPEQPVLLLIDNWRMHLVVGAATPTATYYDNLPFDGERVPSEVSAAIPGP
jgi:hypothetical protein